MDEALTLIDDCFKKAGTTLQESRHRYAWEPSAITAMNGGTC